MGLRGTIAPATAIIGFLKQAGEAYRSGTCAGSMVIAMRRAPGAPNIYQACGLRI